MKKFIYILPVILFLFSSCQNKEEKAEQKFRKGYEQFQKNKLDQAFKSFNQAIDYNSEVAEYYYYRGNIYLNREKFSKAIKDYDRAINLDSTYADAWNNKGTAVFYKTHNKSRACPYWLKAHKLGKSNLINKIKSCEGYEPQGKP